MNSGNKVDLLDQIVVVDRPYWSQHHFDTSAKDRTNIDDAFLRLVREISSSQRSYACRGAKSAKKKGGIIAIPSPSLSLGGKPKAKKQPQSRYIDKDAAPRKEAERASYSTVISAKMASPTAPPIQNEVVVSESKPQAPPADQPSPQQPDTVTITMPTHHHKDEATEEMEEEELELTSIPEALEAKFDQIAVDSTVRPTIINIGTMWTKKYQTDLLTPQVEITLEGKDLETERTKAYDLIDMISKSGFLNFDNAALHVVVASTHCFDRNLMDTVIVDNVNPIEKLEKSNLILATTIHQKEAPEIVHRDHLDSVLAHHVIIKV